MQKATPVLYGDGDHDDTPAIQALMNGQDVLNARTGKIVEANTLPAGTYLVDGEVMDA